MLLLNQISKTFGETKAVDNVSFKTEAKGVIGLLGPNGAGKTTLMRIISGYLMAEAGVIKWSNKIFDPKLIESKKLIGYLPEGNPLYGNIKVTEYLEFMAKLKGVSQKEIVKVIEECGLLEVCHKKIETLSKGYKQRTGLAQAILGDPKILILDEPTTGLDPNQIIEIRKLIKALGKDRLVILSTHILPEAKEVCSRVLIINRGKIVLDDEIKKIRNLEKKFVELTA